MFSYFFWDEFAYGLDGGGVEVGERVFDVWFDEGPGEESLIRPPRVVSRVVPEVGPGEAAPLVLDGELEAVAAGSVRPGSRCAWESKPRSEVCEGD